MKSGCLTYIIGLDWRIYWARLGATKRVQKWCSPEEDTHDIYGKQCDQCTEEVAGAGVGMKSG